MRARSYGWMVAALLVAPATVRAQPATPAPVTEPQPGPAAPVHPDGYDAEAEAAPDPDADGAGVFGLPPRLGPFRIEGDAGWLQLGFGLQLRTTVDSQDGPTRDTSAEVEVRRLRLKLRTSFFDDRVRSYVQVNIVPGAFELLDAMLEGRIFPELAIAIGQMKIPYGIYRSFSNRTQLLADWGPISPWFGAERQLGVRVSGEVADGLIAYAVGAFTGNNRRASHGYRIADVYAEPVTNPSLFDGFSGETDIHPEIVLRAVVKNEHVDLGRTSDADHGPLGYAVAASAAWDSGPVATKDQQLRLSPEAIVQWRGVSGLLVGHIGWASATTGEPRTLLGLIGGMAEVGYRPIAFFEAAARVSYTVVLEELRADARVRADALIAAEPDPAARMLLVDQYASAGELEDELEVGLGANFYFVADDLKLQIDFAWTQSNVLGETLHDFQMRTQAQLAF